ncbi:MAG: Rieske (2Fe-2S) protein [bacterium]
MKYSESRTEFITVAQTSELFPGECKIVTAKNRTLALYNVAGIFYATDNKCCHRNGPLGDGVLNGYVVTCPWHGWRFNVANGECLLANQVRIATYPVQVVGKEIQVKI